MPLTTTPWPGSSWRVRTRDLLPASGVSEVAATLVFEVGAAPVYVTEGIGVEATGALRLPVFAAETADVAEAALGAMARIIVESLVSYAEEDTQLYALGSAAEAFSVDTGALTQFFGGNAVTENLEALGAIFPGVLQIVTGAISVTGAGTVIDLRRITEGLSVVDTVMRGFGVRAAEWAHILTPTTYQWVIPVLEGLSLSAPMRQNLRAALSLADGVRVADVYRLAFPTRVLESLNAATSATSTVIKLVEVAENLSLSGLAVNHLQAIQMVAEMVVAHATAGHAWGLRVLESLGITGTLDDQVRYLKSVLESVAITATPQYAVQVRLVLSETVNLDDTLSVNARLLQILREGISFAGVIRLDDETYDAWVVNTETFAAWQYENFNFNSFAQCRGRYFALNDSGLHELTGDSDNGTPIHATVRTGLINFGGALLSNVPRMYVGYTTDGTLLAKAISTREGQKWENWYTLDARTADVPAPNAAKFDRGAKSVYWQFELTNVDGADFELHDVSVMPVILRRRVR